MSAYTYNGAPASADTVKHWAGWLLFTWRDIENKEAPSGVELNGIPLSIRTLILMAASVLTDDRWLRKDLPFRFR